ncbi:hypothetical protein FBU30_005566 [Linnemannia zychae]|nr:hypothetical protein FBU30_005566 [Linnemannia zychae]
MIQQSLTPHQHHHTHAGLAVSPNKPTRSQRLIPPPIHIPKDIVHGSFSQQTRAQQQPDKIASVVNTNQQHLPSPVLSSTSPESPSSLAIHLYVHHHHHHHSQDPPSSSSTAISQDVATISSAGSLSPNTTSAPLVLLSPLTFPHPALDHQLYPQQYQQPKTVTAVASLPSPPLSSSSTESAQLPSPPPQPAQTAQIASLLPALNIPSAKNNDTLLSPPLSASSPPPITSLPAPTLTKSGSETTDSGKTSRRDRQHRPQLPDPVLASQLLSTISSKDLARLYVHAAHHLHSHQPIRRYVMMKMIMTQAELAQYGRLRAEMPRAPGPSTGAQPKRTGFGSPARSGFAFIPKVPSRLGRYIYSAAAFATTAEQLPAAGWNTAAAGRRQASWVEEEIGMEVWNENSTIKKKKLISLPWTQSLSSLVSLTKRNKSGTSIGKPKASISEPNLYCSSRRLEELELGHHDHHRRYNNTLSSSRQQQHHYHHHHQSTGSGNATSRLRRRGPSGGRIYSEDDYDDGEGSEDTETGDDFEGDENEYDDDEDFEDRQEKPTSYWTMLRSRNTNNNTNNHPSRRRNFHTCNTNNSTKDQNHKEPRIQLNMQYDKEHQQHSYHHQQQQQQQKIISLQQLDPQVIISTSSTKQPTSPNNKSKSHTRRRTAMSNTDGSHSPSSRPSRYLSPNSSTSESGGNHYSLSTSATISNNTILPVGGSDPAASFTEIYGVSGLLMLLLFFVFLFLLEGTNQFYRVQSALLSIIL